jgi:hypothetical protein
MNIETSNKIYDRSQIRRLVAQGASEELIQYIENLREQNSKLMAELANNNSHDTMKGTYTFISLEELEEKYGTRSDVLTENHGTYKTS